MNGLGLHIPHFRMRNWELGFWPNGWARRGRSTQSLATVKASSPWSWNLLTSRKNWHLGTSRHSTSGFDQEKCGKITNKSCPTRAPRQPVSTKKLNVSLPRSFVQDFHAFECSLWVYLRFHPFHRPFTILSPGRSIHGPPPQFLLPRHNAEVQSISHLAQLVALLVTLLYLLSHLDPNTTWIIERSSQVWWKWRYMLTSCDTTKQPYLVVDLFLSTLFLSTSTPWGAILGTHHDPGVTECQNLGTNFLAFLANVEVSAIWTET